MKRSFLIILIIALSTSMLYAEGPMTGLFAAADEVATDIPGTLPGSGELLLGGITYNQLPVSLGDLFADLSANRLTGRHGSGLSVVKWYSSPGYQSTQADWILSGTMYDAGSGYLLTLNIVDTSDGSQVIGWEFGLSEKDVEGLLIPSLMASIGSWDAFEPNDSPEEAALVVLPFSADGLQLSEGDEDWFTIEVPAASGGGVFLLRAGTTGSTDTYMELYSPEDQSWAVAEDDDSDGGNAIIEMPLMIPGTWYLKVRAFSSDTEGEYGLDIDISEGQLGPGEPDEGSGNANQLNVGQSPVEKRIDYTGDEDWFRIVLTRPLSNEEVLRVETLGNGDTLLTLLDEYEGFISSDDDSGIDSNAMVLASGLSAGTYYAVVSGYEGSIAEYSVMANITVPVRDEYEDDYSMIQASEISVGENQQRNFSPVGDIDWVKFRINRDGQYTMRTGGNIDTYLELYDSDGMLIDENDDGSDYNALISRHLTAGEYFLQVHPFGNASPDDVYTLILESAE